MNKKFILISSIIIFLFSFKFSFADSIDPIYKYAWGDTIGWVNFGCDNCNLQVFSDKITGYAWSANYGWINFNPTNGGVRNDGNGNLSGYAWGENLGWIDFSNVKINPSTGEFSGYAIILGGPGGRINFDCSNCKVKTFWRVTQTFSSGSSGGSSGRSSTREQFPTSTILQILNIISEILSQQKLATIKKIPKKIVEILKPKKIAREKIPKLPREEIFLPRKEITKKTPLTMSGKWHLLSYTKLNLPFTGLTLAPLSHEFQKLTQKLPQLKEIFSKVGIKSLIDIEKLKNVKLTLPGLTEIVKLPKDKITKLPPEIQKEVPSEIVFLRGGGQIDVKINLSISEKGELQQKVNVIAGKPLQLIIKPEKPVKSIKGYIVFKSKKVISNSFQFPLESLLSSMIFADPVLAKPVNKPIEIEEKLVLREFEYVDPDGDGIYTAEINMPIVTGEYEIITVIDFEDEELGKKAIRLIAVIDPEGYVYERTGNKETRIPGAIVSLYWFNPKTKKYELWPAEKYQQENPQITDVRGTYAFLVPEGYYYIKVEAPGYLPYSTKPFQAKEGSGITINIELKTKYWWLKIVDWKTVLLIIVVILLFYNFYRDKIREELLKTRKNQ